MGCTSTRDGGGAGPVDADRPPTPFLITFRAPCQPQTMCSAVGFRPSTPSRARRTTQSRHPASRAAGGDRAQRGPLTMRRNDSIIEFGRSMFHVLPRSRLIPCRAGCPEQRRSSRGASRTALNRMRSPAIAAALRRGNGRHAPVRSPARSAEARCSCCRRMFIPFRAPAERLRNRQQPLPGRTLSRKRRRVASRLSPTHHVLAARSHTAGRGRNRSPHPPPHCRSFRCRRPGC